MDQAMVKRGIGAVVLAIIAALLLGYLLKDKSRERQEVVDMKLPDSAEMSIPDLSGSADNINNDNNNVSIVGEAGNTINQAANNATDTMQNAVVASADAVNNTLQTTETPSAVASDAQYSANDPGFSIRPPAINETREIIDERNNNNNAQDGGSAAIAYSTDPVNEVIASSNKAVKTFKPSIVEEKRKPKPKKKVTHKAAQKPAKVATAKTTKPKKAQAPKPAAPAPAKPATSTTVANKPLGKYSIQLLATSSQSRATKLANTMKSEGYKVFVTKAQRNNKILFRVRVGGHASRDEAVKAQDSMKRRY